MSPGPRIAIEEGSVVGDAGGRPLLADVYRPPEPLETYPLRTGPAILVIHGGGWWMGDRTQLRFYGITLAQRGYLCVACEYRLTGEAAWPAQIHDVKTTLRWMRSNAQALAIDPDRIATWGHSAGGHLALLAAGTPNLEAFEGDGGHAGAGTDVAAAVAYYGPAELWRSSEGWSSLDALLGADGSAEDAWAASPLRYAGESFPPTALLHGTADATVPVEQSERMHQALRRNGVPSELHLYAGQPHAFDMSRDFGPQTAGAGALFLDRYLAGTVPRDAPEVREKMDAVARESRRESA